MSIWDYQRRTFTYIAGDWTGDSDAIDKILSWNDGNRWNLHFKNVHEMTQSYDSSNNCSIKSSLAKRMRISKTFVLVVGSETDKLRSGACYLCEHYSNNMFTYGPLCRLGYNVDNRSYIKYEVSLAKAAYDRSEMDIIVLYKSVNVNKSLCPEPLRCIGKHVPMLKWQNHVRIWDYYSVRDAIG